jgi:transcriptional regulator with XRE-family HTH domain
MATIHSHAQEVSDSVGHRLLTIRESRNWTLDELAQRSGVSKAYLSRLEHGNRQPSITVLCAIANALGVSIAALFEQPDEHIACVVVRGGSPVEKVANGLAYQSLSRPTKPFNLQPIEVVIPADRLGDKAYQHDGEEWIRVIEGSVKLVVQDQSYELEVGDCAHFESRQRHRLAALGGKPARIILVACEIPIAVNPKIRAPESIAALVG